MLNRNWVATRAILLCASLMLVAGSAMSQSFYGSLYRRQCRTRRAG